MREGEPFCVTGRAGEERVACSSPRCLASYTLQFDAPRHNKCVGKLNRNKRTLTVRKTLTFFSKKGATTLRVSGGGGEERAARDDPGPRKRASLDDPGPRKAERLQECGAEPKTAGAVL